MDTFQELKRESGVVVRNILTTIKLPESDGLPVYNEIEFEKALSEGTIEVFSEEKVSQFNINLKKAEAEAYGDARLLDNIEKAQRDISKLVKVKRQDKNGKMNTVYVRATDKAKEGGDGKKSEVGKISRAHAESNPDDAIHTYSKEIAHHSGMSHDEYKTLRPDSKKSLLKTLLTHPAHNVKGKETVPGDEKNEESGGLKDGAHYLGRGLNNKHIVVNKDGSHDRYSDDEMKEVHGVDDTSKLKQKDDGKDLKGKGLYSRSSGKLVHSNGDDHFVRHSDGEVTKYNTNEMKEIYGEGANPDKLKTGKTYQEEGGVSGKFVRMNKGFAIIEDNEGVQWPVNPDKLKESSDTKKKAKFNKNAIPGYYHVQDGEHEEESARKFIEDSGHDIDNERSSRESNGSHNFYNKGGERIGILNTKGILRIRNPKDSIVASE